MERNQRTIVHPDENLLTAFAERTLTPGERERVMTRIGRLFRLPRRDLSRATSFPGA